MYLDLNIPWPTHHLNYLLQQSSKKSKQTHSNPSKSHQTNIDIWHGISPQEKQNLRDLVECAIKLGYSVIAFNLIIPQSLDPLLLAPHFPFPDDQPPFADLDPRTCSNSNSNHFDKTILQLSRLTLVMDEKGPSGAKGVFGFASSQATYLSQYSILSLMPLDSVAFSHACLSLSTPSPTGIDLISLDLASSSKLPFQMQLSTVSQALKNHVLFELNYSPTTSANRYLSYSSTNFPIVASSTNCRRNLVSGAKDLIRVTNCGKGLVISSGAKTWSELRSGDDVVNFMNVVGISHEFAKKATTANPKAIVSKARSTRLTHKGVISNPIVVVSSLVNSESSTSLSSKDHGHINKNDGPLKRGFASTDSQTTSDSFVEDFKPSKRIKNQSS
ncbi:hypothetical protein O181_036211 [Austropuccinia psidii MF-1]|uniref:Uncharacterized protein n=1 Tax=Austropuccinia psidii MF-1 TaxID=1389203 RepID=A0A9Q3H9Q2_9BASI|nr:hypothetical protein [Austropuccinia psidii MF-1]